MSALSGLKTLVNPESPIAFLRDLLPLVCQLVDAQENNLVVPSGDAVVDAAVRDGLVREAASIASGAYAKMMADESGRLGPTLMLLRACRLFDYKKVSSMTLEAIKQESHHLLALPIASPANGAGIQRILDEVPTYSRLAREATTRDQENGAESNIAEFWNAVEVDPNVETWYRISRDVLLITPSSAAVERVFSIHTQAFSDGQQNALHDYQLLSTMLKYNKNFPEPSK